MPAAEAKLAAELEDEVVRALANRGGSHSALEDEKHGDKAGKDGTTNEAVRQVLLICVSHGFK